MGALSFFTLHKRQYAILNNPHNITEMQIESAGDLCNRHFQGIFLHEFSWDLLIIQCFEVMFVMRYCFVSQKGQLVECEVEIHHGNDCNLYQKPQISFNQLIIFI